MTSSASAYLFVAHNMELGGIESLLARMSSAVVELGYLTIVASPDGPMVAQLHGAVRQIRTTEQANVSDILINQLDISTETHLNIWASLPTLALDLHKFQEQLWRRRHVSSSCVSGIFHPAQIRRDAGLTMRNLVAAALQRLTPTGATYFMNEATRDAHVQRWGRHLAAWPVHRLALTAPDLRWSACDTGVLRIVSVGRLVSFKAYNRAAISVCSALKALGIDASWDIWGDGEDRESLSREIAVAGLEGTVRLRGTLPYSDFAETVAAYDVFVGMGTAALEAACLAMPTILSIVDSELGTYGFLSTAPSDSVGETVPGVKPEDLTMNLANYAKMAARERECLGQACMDSVLARAGEEPAPYSALFENGHRVPDRLGRNLGYAALAVSFRLKHSRRAAK